MVKDYHGAYVRLRSQTTGDWLVHPDLRGLLVADALAEGTNLTEVVTRILSGRHNVPYEPGGRRTDPRADQDVLNMRLPIRLWRKIRTAASRSGRHDMDEVRHELCAHYGLDVPARPSVRRAQ